MTNFSDASIRACVSRVAALTQNNDHTEAYIEVCRFIGADDLAESLRAVQIKQNRAGYLTYDLLNRRDGLYLSMKAAGYAAMGSRFDAIYLAL